MKMFDYKGLIWKAVTGGIYAGLAELAVMQSLDKNTAYVALGGAVIRAVIVGLNIIYDGIKIPKDTAVVTKTWKQSFFEAL